MNDRFRFDFKTIMDDVFEASENFQEAVKNGFQNGPHNCWKKWDERVDFYPAHAYPPANVYMDKEKTLYFEFALAGFKEDQIDLQFQGDYMVLNITVPEQEKKDEEEKIRYFKRRLKMKSVKDQKYYVPEDRFDRENVKAVYKSGLLAITISSKEVVETKEGIKVEIVREAE